MPGPFDYTLKGPMPDLAGSLLAGGRVAGGLLDARIGAQDAAIRQAENDRAAQADQMKMAAVAQAQQAAAAQAQAAAEARAKWAALGPDATHRQMAELIQQNPQALSLPGFKEAFDAQNEAAKQQTISDLSIPLALLSNGQPDMAIEALDKQWAAYENSNDSGSARSRQRLGELIKQDPEAARRTIFQMLNPVLTKDQREGLFALDTSDAKIRKDKADASAAEQDAVTKTQQIYAELGYKKAQVDALIAKAKNDAGELNFKWAELAQRRADAQAKAEEGVFNLAKDVRKFNEDDVAAATKAAATAAQGDAIIKALEEADPASGVFGQGRDVVVNAWGGDSDAQNANQQYIELRNKLIRARQGPGEKMTDADFEEAKKAFPGEQASKDAKVRTIKRLAAESKAAADAFTAQARFRSLTGGQGNSRQTVNVNGLDVPAGTDLATFNNMWRDFQHSSPTAPSPTSSPVHDEAKALGLTPVK